MMYLPTMTRNDLELCIIENDIMDVMQMSDDMDTEEMRAIVGKWIAEGDECSNS
jgi:hypothetical protein